MSIVRIVCKRPGFPPAPSSGSYPRINQLLPTLTDCEVMLVGEDGVEHHIAGVSAITFRCRQGAEEIATAILEIDGVEIDAEALLLEERPR